MTVLTRRCAGGLALTGALCALALTIIRAQPDRSPEPLRPLFHFTPPRNFMNDPNGLVFYKGEYHLFYQHNPVGNTWGHMSWGHAVSRDMMRWQHLPVALSEADGVMIFSGSVVVDWKNTSGFCRPSDGDPSCLVGIYTGHGRRRQTQNLAYSNDRGRTWTKYPGNPVIDLGLENFRDPKVFWHEPSQRWVMVTVLADQHKVRFFAARDLKSWETLSDFGPAGATGGVWECPDLFPLPVDAQPSEVRWVLDVDINPGAVSGGSGGQYFVGRFDGRTFVNDNPPGQTMWVDYGKDFYATLSFSDFPASDNRRIWMGWISNWLYANEEPTPTWRGAQSVPRELQLRRLPDGIRLVQAPIRELNNLRGRASVAIPAAGMALPPGADIEIDLPAFPVADAGLRFGNANGEEVLVGLKASPSEVFIDRRNARKGAWHKDYPGRHAAPVRAIDGRVSLRILFDRSVIEVFVNGGERVLTDRVYPTAPYDHVAWIGGVPPQASQSRLWTIVPSM